MDAVVAFQAEYYSVAVNCKSVDLVLHLLILHVSLP